MLNSYTLPCVNIHLVAGMQMHRTHRWRVLAQRSVEEAPSHCCLPPEPAAPAAATAPHRPLHRPAPDTSAHMIILHTMNTSKLVPMVSSVG